MLDIFSQINKLFSAAIKDPLLAVTILVLAILLVVACKLDSAAPKIHQIMHLALICATVIVFIFFII